MVSRFIRICTPHLALLLLSTGAAAQTTVVAGRMNEVFQQTVLSPANALNDPWEITYGADGWLWITEAKGYRVQRMNPGTGAKTTVLDLSQNSTFLPVADRPFNLQFSMGTGAGQYNPQGGLAGLALHPDFMDPVNPKKYVYVSYIHAYVSTAANNAGVFFTNYLVRFTYDAVLNKLGNPVALCDTLPGSSDHNSQRLIIAPVNGTDYLFYASGDMGAGQFGNSNRPNKAQIAVSYEGKILRFNLEPDADAGAYDKWIPNTNPFNGAKQSAVWCTGIRNNQGFAAANISGTDYLYGSSHGPFSDDELNILQSGKNYGHPLVIGYSADGNYNNSKAGTPSGALPLIASESANATAIGAAYRDPIFSGYNAPQATVNNLYLNNPSNSGWPSEAWSGMEVYTNALIPGWKNSLVLGGLKWGRVLRFKLSASGAGVIPINGFDTLTNFSSTNRYRDVAFSPDGEDVFVIMDKSAATSGPSTANPSIPGCPGCLFKYHFLGYQNNTSNGKSTIPTAIDVTTGTPNTCTNATTIAIDNANNNLWVPITGPDGNILAEIKANGNNLGTVTASFYTNASAVREDAGRRLYLDRNITITPQVQPTSAVGVRLYITTAEFNALKAATNSLGMSSGVTAISNLAIFKNSDACGAAIRRGTAAITPLYAEAHGTTGYMLQTSVNSFSSFYFGSGSLTTLPLQIVLFKGAMQNNDVLLQWKTAAEKGIALFDIERSTNGASYENIGSLPADSNDYRFTDKGAARQSTTVLYYRLKAKEENGAFSYSNVVTVHVPQPFDVLVFPNPVKEKVTIRFTNNTAKAATITVSDMLGHVVYEKTEPAILHSTIAIDVRNWTPHVYFVKIVNSSMQVLAIQKFEKW